MSKLTLEKFLDLNKNLIVDDNGNTNKKCPLCNNDIIVERDGAAITIKCKTPNCFSSTGRGI